MPQESKLYGVARVRSHEKDLLGRERMRRLADASAEDALRMLLDAGYGNMPDATLDDIERLVTSQLNETYELIREVTTDEPLTDLFLMKADVQNLKLLLKLRLTQSREQPAYSPGGVYPPEELAGMVKDSDYSELPEFLRSELESLEVGFFTRVDPVELSTRLDGAYFRHARDYGDGFATAYFTALTDFDNLLALLRVQAMGGSEAQLSRALLPEGDIPADKLRAALDTPADALGRLAAGPAKDAIQSGLAEAARTGRISALEKARDDYLIRLASRDKNENESIAPIIGYMLAREQEAKCVRLILTAKRNGLPDSIITERLRELYG